MSKKTIGGLAIIILLILLGYFFMRNMSQTEVTLSGEDQLAAIVASQDGVTLDISGTSTVRQNGKIWVNVTALTSSPNINSLSATLNGVPLPLPSATTTMHFISQPYSPSRYSGYFEWSTSTTTPVGDYILGIDVGYGGGTTTPSVLHYDHTVKVKKAGSK